MKELKSMEEFRYRGAVMLVDMARTIALSPRGLTVFELADKYGCCQKTVRRMLFAMERYHWPVRTIGAHGMGPLLWKMDKSWFGQKFNTSKEI